MNNIAIMLLFSHLFLILNSPIISYAKTDTKNYPWYFGVNGVTECWDRGITGKGVVVEVWDSKVYFVSLLKDKKYKNGSKSYVNDCNKNKTFRSLIHGTGMASLIAADNGSKECYKKSTYPCNETFIAGLAPSSKIYNREIFNSCETFSNKNRFKLLKEALNLKKDYKEPKINDTYFGKKVLLEEKEEEKNAKIILINCSFTESGLFYLEIPKGFRKHKNYQYLLLVAGVGNEPKEFTEETKPAGLKVKGLSVLRVGATNRYDKKNVDILYKGDGTNAGSAYGELVDILTPGEEIPFLMFNGKAYIADGTSEATAIVTGALALMASCNPDATADQLKQALLNGSDIYKNLEKKVKNGRVLNIYKSVEELCFEQPTDEL